MLSQKGFTLIELLVAIVMLGLLAATLILFIDPIKQLNKARDAQRENNLKQVQDALDTYYNDNNSYPQSITFGQPFESANGSAEYFNKLPQDPDCVSGGSCYQYVTNTTIPNPQWGVLFAKVSQDNTLTNPCPLQQIPSCLPTNFYTAGYNYCVILGNVDCSYISTIAIPTSGGSQFVPTPTMASAPTNTPTPGPTSTPTPTTAPPPTNTPTPTFTPTPTPVSCNVAGYYNNEYKTIVGASSNGTSATVTLNPGDILVAGYNGNGPASSISIGGPAVTMVRALSTAAEATQHSELWYGRVTSGSTSFTATVNTSATQWATAYYIIPASCGVSTLDQTATSYGVSTNPGATSGSSTYANEVALVISGFGNNDETQFSCGSGYTTPTGFNWNSSDYGVAGGSNNDVLGNIVWRYYTTTGTRGGNWTNVYDWGCSTAPSWTAGVATFR